MIEEFEGLGDLHGQVEALEVSLGGAAGMAAGIVGLDFMLNVLINTIAEAAIK